MLHHGTPVGTGGLPPRRVWPFVGRTAELAAIEAALAEDAGGVVLAGPAGVGKSRLARALRDRARDAGSPTEEVVATQAAASIPLGAFAHVLPDLQAPGAILVDLLSRATAELVERAGGGRLVLTVDDAHLLDDASAALVHRLARIPQVFVVATVRSREPAPDAVVALWKEQLAVRLEIEPLGEAELEELVGAALGGRPNRALLHRVLEVSGGNPLVTRELLLSGLEEGALTEAEGVWRWEGATGSGKRLQEFVAARLERLDDEERRALEIIAFGEPLGVSLLEKLVGVEVVDSLERQELVAVHREERRVLVRLVHPVYAEALRAGTPPRRAGSAQRALADAVAAAGARRREDKLQVALWRLESGGPQDPETLVEAAQEAIASFDHVLGERLARAALPAGGEVAELVLGRALHQQGKGEEAEAVWKDLSTRADSVEMALSIATLRSNNLFFSLGRADEAKAVLVEAERTLPPEMARHPLELQRSVYSLYGGRPVEARAITQSVINSPDVCETELPLAAVIGAPALAITGEADEAVRLCDRTFPLALQLPGADATMVGGQILAARFLALTIGGRLAEAQELAEVVHRLAIDHASHDGLAAMSCALGQVALARGKPRTAIGWLREAAALLRVHDRNGFLPWCLGELAAAATIVGDLAEADAALAEADGRRHASLSLFDVELAIGRAWRRWADGDRAATLQILEDAWRWADETGQAVFAGLALHAAARLGFAAEVVERLEELAARIDAREVQLAARHARAVVDADGAALDQVSVAFEELGALLRAAEAAAQASVVHGNAGRTAASTASAQQARALATRCEGARTPSLVLDDAPKSATLTRREEEVARLAATGLASRTIAERLFLSVRTVDNHLHRAYYKLGVSNRRELAEVLSNQDEQDAK